jgi:hypothetical protein
MLKIARLYLAAFLSGAVAVLAPSGVFTGHLPTQSELAGAVFAGALAMATLFMKSPSQEDTTQK